MLGHPRHVCFFSEASYLLDDWLTFFSHSVRKSALQHSHQSILAARPSKRKRRAETSTSSKALRMDQLLRMCLYSSATERRPRPLQLLRYRRNPEKIAIAK